MCQNIKWHEYEFDLKNRKGHVKVVREIVYEDQPEQEEEFA